MIPLHSIEVDTYEGKKSIEVYACDVMDFDEKIDVLTTSAFHRIYSPTPTSVFGALSKVNIQANELAKAPIIDLRGSCNIWLSAPTEQLYAGIGRISCIEMSPYSKDRHFWTEYGNNILNQVKMYFHMLDIASLSGVPVETVALPLLGTGLQGISWEFIIVPLLNECREFLKRNSFVKRICIIEKNNEKAFQAAKRLDSLYSASPMLPVQAESAKHDGAQEEKLVFISYSSHDKNVADNLCAKCEARGIKVWYAPRDIRENDFASAIVHAVLRCTHFVVIISNNSLKSQHVLNEVDLAFGELSRNIRFLPLRIDQAELEPAFSYYLSRQHWLDASIPPIEKHLEELVDRIV